MIQAVKTLTNISLNHIVFILIDTVLLFKGIFIGQVQRNFQLCIYGCIADCPAMKMLLNMIGHTGYHCCFLCHIRGTHCAEARKRQYPYTIPIDFRTTRSFRVNSMNAEKHQRNILGHLGTSVLTTITDIPLPHCIMIDYAHVTLLRHFRDVVRTISLSLAPATRKEIDRALRFQRFPHFFHRKMRGIEDFSHIKAVELRNLLLYGFIPHFLPYLTTDQFCFMSLFIIGVRLLHGRNHVSQSTSRMADLLLSSYYRDHHLFFKHHANLVLHLHQHYGQSYEWHGPLSSVNTFAQEDFMGYMSKNRNGTTYFGDQMAYYYNIDVHLKCSIQESTSICDGK